MEKIATLERVRAAYDQLKALHEKPSADRIVAIVGGSKSTVLGHMRTIFEDHASGGGPFDPARELLEVSAQGMVRKLWEEANSLSSRAYENRLQALVGMQAGLFEDLKAAFDAESAALARAEAAEARVLSLEAELAAMKKAEEHIGMLKDFMESLRNDPDLPAMAQLLDLLGDGKRHDKQEIYRRMKALGYETAQLHRARYHAIKSKYVVELAEDEKLPTGLLLTADGILKVRPSAG